MLILVNAPLEAFAAVMAFDALACTIGLVISLKMHPDTATLAPGRDARASIILEAWPFVLSGVSIMVYSRIDQIMIKEILDDRALGIYAAALPLSQFWLVIPMTLATSLAPFIAKRKSADEQGYQHALVLVFRILLPGLGRRGHHVARVQLPRAPPVQQLAESVHLLNVHVLSNVFCFLGVAHGLWLVNERRFAVRLYGTLLGRACHHRAQPRPAATSWSRG